MEPLTDDQIADLIVRPNAFAEIVLGLRLSGWQDRVLQDLDEAGSRVVLRCCNGAGKTSHVGAAAVLWHMHTFPGSVTVVTSGSWRQVETQFIPAVKRHGILPQFRRFDFQSRKILSADGTQCVFLSTSDAMKFEGYHEKDEVDVGGMSYRPPLLIIADEAKSIEDETFQAMERCQPTRMLVMSSPGDLAGMFYRLCTAVQPGVVKRWKRHHVSALDCPWVDEKWIQNVIDTYGRDSWFTRSTVDGEFVEDPDSGIVIPYHVVQGCLDEPAGLTTDTTVHAACDFASGGDENVFAVRAGNVVKIVRTWRDTNTAQAIGDFIDLFRMVHEVGERRVRLTPDNISGDDSGMGKVFIDRMHELGWPVRRWRNNARANDSKAFADKAAEMWWRGRQAIEGKRVRIPDDDVLISQLTTRKWKRLSDCRRRLESKEEMRIRGLDSPDRAEAVLMAMEPPLKSMWDEYDKDTESKIFIQGGVIKENRKEHTDLQDELGFFAGY